MLATCFKRTTTSQVSQKCLFYLAVRNPQAPLPARRVNECASFPAPTFCCAGAILVAAFATCSIRASSFLPGARALPRAAPERSILVACFPAPVGCEEASPSAPSNTSVALSLSPVIGASLHRISPSLLPFLRARVASVPRGTFLFSQEF